LIAVTYSTDTTIEQIIEKGNFEDIKEEIELYTANDDVLLITADSLNYSNLFNRVLHVPCGFRVYRPFNWLLFYIKGFYALSKNKDRISVIRAFGTGCPHAALSSLLHKIPLMVSYEYDWPEQLILTGRVLSAYIAKLVEKMVLRSSTLTIGLTKRLCEKARRKGSKQVIHIPNSINLKALPMLLRGDRQRLRSKIGANREKIVLFVGRLNRIKAVDILIRSIALLLKKKLDIKLLIIGDGEERGRLMRLAESLQASNETIFLGAMNRSEVLKYMQAADVFVLPSHMEGNPKVLLEAMASKIPIVGSDVVGINDLVENHVTGTLVQPSNPFELSKAIESTITNRKQSKETIEQAYRTIINNFNREKVNKRILELLTHISHR